MKTTIATLSLLTLTVLAGCVGETNADPDCWKNAPLAPLATKANPPSVNFNDNKVTAYADAGFDGTNWPDLTGKSIVILDHGAFGAFKYGDLAAQFENLTGAKVTHVEADDAGSSLTMAIQDQKAGGGTFDILYGIDNVLMSQAQAADIFDPYTPLNWRDVEPEFRFAPIVDGMWLATPVDHGYIGINVDARSDVQIASFDDLVTHADNFVTQDPRLSSPGLGFLVATVATYGEECFAGYWTDLLENGAKVTSGWTEAYEFEFTGGYGQWEDGFAGDREIVNSYTTSPAYEMSFGYDEQNRVLIAPGTTFHQIQTLGILKGADRIAAEAWIEFSLTNGFQSLAASMNAIYPVVSNSEVDAAVDEVYVGRAPMPGSFSPATFTSEYLGENVESWVETWVEVYEAATA